MLRWLAVLGVTLPLPLGAQVAVTLPSGQQVTLIEVLSNIPGSEGLATRFRFLSPDVTRGTGSIDVDTAGADMDWLCTTYALPRLPTNGPQPAEIIISMSDMDVPFGEDHPEATQFFASYSIADGTCQMGMF